MLDQRSDSSEHPRKPQASPPISTNSLARITRVARRVCFYRPRQATLILCAILLCACAPPSCGRPLVTGPRLRIARRDITNEAGE